MTNLRLAWNFEICSKIPLQFNFLEHKETEQLRWECRYFWPAHQCITLYHLGDEFLNLANYEFKEHADTYILLPENPLNIKLRDQRLLYKPIIERENGCVGFGKKMDLLSQSSNELLIAEPVLTVGELINTIHEKGRAIHVEKTAMKFKLPTKPLIKMELARLKVKTQVFFSFCLEGKSQYLVEYLQKHLIKEQVPCDYITFLSQTEIS